MVKRSFRNKLGIMGEDLTAKKTRGLEFAIPDQAFNQTLTQIWFQKWVRIEDGLISLDGTYIFITLDKKHKSQIGRKC